MSTWLPALFGKRDSAKSATEAIVTLRKQLAILEKKDDHLQNKIEIEHKKAKELLAANKKSGATGALRRKKAFETQLSQLEGTRLTLETQLNALESANFNAQTLAALSHSQRALKQIHKDLDITKVDDVLEDLRSEVENAKMVGETIATPLEGNTVDDEEILEELRQLEHDALDERLRGEEPVEGLQAPNAPTESFRSNAVRAEDDEEEQLRELQASLAM